MKYGIYNMYGESKVDFEKVVDAWDDNLDWSDPKLLKEFASLDEARAELANYKCTKKKMRSHNITYYDYEFYWVSDIRVDEYDDSEYYGDVWDFAEWD